MNNEPCRKRARVQQPDYIPLLQTAGEIIQKANLLWRYQKLDELRSLLESVQCTVTPTKIRENFIDWKGAKAVVENNIKLLEAKLKAKKKYPAAAPISRVVTNSTVGLDASLKHDMDFAEFKTQVLGLFHWYNPIEMRSFMAPCMSMIQSSGTGKTRLLVGLRDESITGQIDYDCFTILCLDRAARNHDNEVVDRKTYFDETLAVPVDEGQAGQRELMTETLQRLMAQASKKRLILLFDQAQNLLEQNSGAAFHTVHWWLRQRRGDIQVVAVFAGTSTMLATNINHNPPSTISRLPRAVYLNWTNDDSLYNPNPTKQYPPFLRLRTMGCYRDCDVSLNNSLLTDFEKAAYFGRPLFAYLQTRNWLVNKGDTAVIGRGVIVENCTLHSILKRMLLSDSSNWRSNKTALCSILGSRVQMGIITSVRAASDLVSHAYAHLVNLPGHDDIPAQAVLPRIAFMPDPVCAALAMGLMHSEWTLKPTTTKENVDNTIKGEDAHFWSMQAMELFVSGLCLPEKANAGDVMVALYMLFCGDVLRFAHDKTLRKFSVPLLDWYCCMRDPNEASQRKQAATSNGVRLEINFIQVCRNYFHANSWKTQKALKFMYDSATAMYVYPDCEAIDLVAAIRVESHGTLSYHPLLVSLKCGTQRDEAVEKMKEMLNNIRAHDEKDLELKIQKEIQNQDEKLKQQKAHEGPVSKKQRKKANKMDAHDKEERDQVIRDLVMAEFSCPPALCLFVLVGAHRETKAPETKDETDSEHLGNFPVRDTFRFITVAENDMFGISKAVRDMKAMYAATAWFSSHSFVHGTDH